MFVIVMEDRLLSPAAVCKNCPMASQSGLPRWGKGRLRCGRPINLKTDCAKTNCHKTDFTGTGCNTQKLTETYECTMGFRIAKLSEALIE